MSLYVDIKKRFAGFTLNVQFEADKQPLGILGASGGGKSMTLKAIAGIVTPDEGQIVVDGRVLFDSKKKINVRPQQRRVGYLLQNHALFPNMTVKQNIAEAIKGKKSERDAKIEELLTRVALDGYGVRYPSELSGGQQQRVAVARVLASEPDVLLLDEPFSALDAHLKAAMQVDMLARLAEFSGYAVMVSHDRDEVYKLCPSLLVLQQGAVDSHGATKRLFAYPERVETARLTGCKNIMPATKVAEHTVYVPDWNLQLNTVKPVPDAISHVGIRAHRFHAATTEDPHAFSFALETQVEGPFEWEMQVRPADASEALWWLASKTADPFVLPDRLSVDAVDVLALS